MGVITNLIKGMGSLVILVVLTLIVVTTIATVDTETGSYPNGTRNITYTNSTQDLGNKINGVRTQTPYNSYLDFDGVNDAVNTQNTFNLVNQSTSVCFWFKINNFNSGVADGLFIYRDSGNNNRFYVIKESAGFIRFNAYSSSNDIALTEFINNTWYQYCAIRSYINISMAYAQVYLNGTIKQNNSLTPSNTGNDYNFNIGSFNEVSSFLNGSIDEVRIYNGSLTSAEVSEIYNSGRIANSSLPNNDLILWYKFNEGNDTAIAYDSSGEGNNGV